MESFAVQNALQSTDDHLNDKQEQIPEIVPTDEKSIIQSVSQNPEIQAADEFIKETDLNLEGNENEFHFDLNDDAKLRIKTAN